MSNNITLNIVEPGSGPTPIDPVVPNTGLFTSGIGSTEATIITVVSAVLILTIVAIVLAVLYKKHKKQNKTTKLVHMVDTCKSIAKSKKRITAGLSAIALIASAGTFATLLSTANKNNTNALEAEDGLTLDISGGDITIELADEPVFAIAEVKATVAEETPAGYTLTAYTDNTDLVSTTDSSKVIPMVAVEGDELSALIDNTYGLSLVEPEDKDDEVYTSLSTDADTPTILAEKEEATEADNTTKIYYGFYITPETPYGTYASGDIYYEAEENGPATATVIFDGNGKFYFDGDESTTTNTIGYIPGNNEVRYSHTPNVNDEGVQTPGEMYPLDSNETFVYEFDDVDNVYVDVVRTGNDSACGPDQGDYFSIWSGAYPDYTAKANWETALSLNGSNGKNIFDNDGKYDGAGVNVEGDAVTIAYTTSGSRQSYCERSGYGYYAKVIGYNPNIVASGEYESPATNGAYRFLGWSTDKTATTPTYKTADDIARSLSLTAGEPVTLYAISEPAYVVYYNGNGADSTTNMTNIQQYTTDLESTSKQVDLLASNFKKDGYGFAGWSTDQDAASKINNTGDDKPTIYGPNQMITVDPSTTTKLNLYAVWVPAETSTTMQTFNPNSEPYASKPNGTVIALEDERDNEVYAVAKLADGNYWMIENLRLDNEPELSANNTHNPSLPLTNNYAEGTTSNFLSATSNDWCTSSSEECLNQSKLNTNNVENTTASPSFSQDFTSNSHNGNFDGNIASYGNYYNWYSATAGNGTYDKSSGEVAGDICPAGWILPIGNETEANGSFSHLDVSMGGTGSYQGSTEASNRWRSFPNNFVYSGSWYGSSAYYRGYYGYYWSSTAYSTNGAYNLDFYSGYVGPGTNSYDKYYGYSVRCVAPVE